MIQCVKTNNCIDDLFIINIFFKRNSILNVMSFFPRDVLDEIWDLTESVSAGFPTYAIIKKGYFSF